MHFEHERDERAQARAEREQATRISSWSVICKQHVAQEGEVTDGILVRNASETPFTTLRSPARCTTGAYSSPLSLECSPPGEHVLFWHPQKHWTFPVRADEVSGEVRPVMRSDSWRLTHFCATSVTACYRPASRRALSAGGSGGQLAISRVAAS